MAIVMFIYTIFSFVFDNNKTTHQPILLFSHISGINIAMRLFYEMIT